MNLIISSSEDFSNILYQFTGNGLLIEAELFVRVLLAALMGLIIGNERKNQNKAAGARTHAIVALGAALVIVLSVHGFEDVDKGDAARLAAQVVCGVGFLGAGIIFVRNNSVKGLTTAAGIWATAGIGLAFGAGMYLIAAASGCLILLVHKYPGALIPFSEPEDIGNLKIDLVQSPGAVSTIQKMMADAQIEIVGMSARKSENGIIKVEFDLVYPGDFDKESFLKQMSENKAIQNMAEQAR